MEEASEQKPSTEELILRAAEREFLDKGYAGARTAAIAEAAGVTHAMLHYYFRSKDKLFEQIVAEKMKKLGDIMFGAIGNAELPLKERVIQGVERHFDFLAANPDLPRFIVNEIACRPERIEMMRTQLLSRASDLLMAMQREFDRVPGPKVDALMLFVDLISLNVFPFIAAPLLQRVVGEPAYGNYDEFLQARKRANVKTILEKLNLQ